MRKSNKNRKNLIVLLGFILFLVHGLQDVRSRGIPIISTEDLNRELTPLIPVKGKHIFKQKVLIVGFDGFTYRIVDKLISEETMVNFKKIIMGGSRLNLRSTDFPSSAVAWPAISTGCGPEKTGLDAFFYLDPGNYEFKLANATFRESYTIWELVSQQGKCPVVVNVPMSFPPAPTKGVILAGLLSPEQGTFTQPGSLSPVLRKLGYRTGYQAFKNAIQLGETAFCFSGEGLDINDMFDITLNRYTLTAFLLNRVDWDLGMVVFTLPDRLQHNQAQLGTSVIEHAYRQMDVLLGGLMKKMDENTTLMVISDHGFRPYTRVFNLGSWLIDEGYIRLDPTGSPDWTQSKIIPIDRVGSTAALRWNILDREGSGILNQEQIKVNSPEFNRLKEKLQALQDSNGNQVIREVRQIKSSRSGPEILVETMEWQMQCSMVHGAPWFSYLEEPVYDHEHNGIGILYHPGVIRSGINLDCHVTDITPTALYQLGMSIPEDLDGRAITEAIEPEYQKRNPVRKIDSSIQRKVNIQTDFDQKHVKDQLKALGYLEGSQ